MIDHPSHSLVRQKSKPHINAEEVKRLEVPHPSLDVQHRLVAELAAAAAERDRALKEAERRLTSFEPWAHKEMGLSLPTYDDPKVYAIRRNAAAVRIDPFFHSPEFVEIERVIRVGPHASLGSLVQFSSDAWNAKEYPEPTFRYIEISGVDRRRGQAKASDVSVAGAPTRARMAVQPDDIIVVHPVNGEVSPVKGRPWKLPHYANRGKTSSSGGELASARSCFSTVRTALGKLRITGLLARLDDCSEFSTVPTASATAADYMDKRTGSRFGIRKVPTASPPPHLPDDPL